MSEKINNKDIAANYPKEKSAVPAPLSRIYCGPKTWLEGPAVEERSQTRNKALAILRLQEKLHLIVEQRHAA